MPTCLFRVRLNSLLSIWYTLGSTLLQSWLLYLGFARYRLYMEMQWPTGGYPQVWLTVYISLLAACIPLLALFLAFGLLKSGNLASDNERLGARPKRTIELIKGGMGQTAVRLRHSNAYRFCHCVRSLWLHSPPMAQSLHILLALIQLFAQQTILAQLYRWGFINSGDFLNTELDWLFQRARQLATNLPMGETRLQSFRISTDELTASPVAPNVLPILMHTRLFGIPLEFVNLLIALIAFSSVYPAVFWRASRPFSACFSAFLAIHSLNFVWTYLGFTVLFRIQETNFYGGRPVGMGQHLWALRSLPLFHPLAIVGTFWLTVALMQLAPVALYSFGYGKFVASQQLLRRQRRSTIIGQPPTSMGAGSCSLRGNSAGARDERCMDRGDNGDQICDGYTPHVSAIALLLVIAAVKAPAFYAIGLIYQKEERPLLLWCLVADLGYLFCWILLWLLHTIKCQWAFRAHWQAHELIALQDAHKTAEAPEGKSASELKGALMLVHGRDVFITDDPMAKPAIIRQALKSCLPAEDIPPWLRCSAPLISAPATQSPQRRLIMAPSGAHHPNLIHVNNPNQRPEFTFPTPDLGYLRRQLQQQQEQQQMAAIMATGDESSSSSGVPLAAPPYQRMASLPPIGVASQRSNISAATTGYGTLQRSQKAPRAVTAPNDYASFMRDHQQQLYGDRQQLQNQQQKQPVQMVPPATTYASGGTLSRSYNGVNGNGAGVEGATAANLLHQQQMIPIQTVMMAPPESYATIHRRSSKSSVGSAGFGASGVAPVPSPQLMRAHRSASLARATEQMQQKQQSNNGGGGGGQPQQHGIYGQYNGGTMTRRGGGQQQSSITQQQPQLLNGATIDQYQQQPKPVVLPPTIQRQRSPLGPSTFGAAGGGGGIWQQDGGGLVVMQQNGTATTESCGEGGTTPASGSVTLGGDSRVASAASDASSSAQATFDLVTAGGKLTMNGANGVKTDCATLTRDGLRGLDGGQKWKGRNGAGGANRAKDEFATSVV